MITKELYEKEVETLRWLARRRSPIPPTIPEIASGLSIPLGTANSRVRALKRKGLVAGGDGTHRSNVMTEKGKRALRAHERKMKRR